MIKGKPGKPHLAITVSNILGFYSTGDERQCASRKL